MLKKYLFTAFALLFAACSSTLSPAQQKINNADSVSFAQSATKRFEEVTNTKNKASLEAVFYLAIMESSNVIEFSTAAQRAFCQLDFATMEENFPKKRLDGFEKNCNLIRYTKWYSQKDVINRANFVKTLATNYINEMPLGKQEAAKTSPKAN